MPGGGPPFTIERTAELPADFGELLDRSLEERFGALQRMRDDWDSGANRFDRPGEALLLARVGRRLAGICGLNRDPYAQSPTIGRVRHLYVRPECRRRGIGRRLVSSVVEIASESFSQVRLRTLDAGAGRFYIALGFSPVAGDRDATHEIRTPGPAGTP